MTRKTVQQRDPNQDTRGAMRTGPPECWRCGKDGKPGFVGEASDTATPYVYCGGDPARHQRQPVGAAS